jgi:hypothetical protein
VALGLFRHEELLVMNLKIEIPFDADVFMRQVLFSQKLKTEKRRWEVIWMFLVSTWIFVISLIVGISQERYIDGPTIVFFFFFIYSVRSLLRLFWEQKEFKDRMIKVAAYRQEKNYTCCFEFTDQYIRQVCEHSETKTDWIAFDSYSERDDNIFLNLEDSFDYSAILGKDELGKENYDVLLKFLKEESKLRLKT